MKALTIWQPWASLIIEGVKPYEFRSWPAPRSIWGQRIAIHAGARPVRKGEVAVLVASLRRAEAWTTALKSEALAFLEHVHTAPGMLPLSCILGTVVIGEPIPSTRIIAGFGGPVNDSDRVEHSNWAWPLTSIERLLPPEPARGAQGFWDWMP